MRTRITDLYSIRLPIIAGSLMWLADANYVSAAANAGIIGFINAASFTAKNELRSQIRLCRKLCAGKPFGVNVSMLPGKVAGDKTKELLEIIISEGVCHVETSGRDPGPYVDMLKSAGVTVLHKVPSIRYAKKAQALGVDAVAIVGAECGGHPGMDLIGSMVNAVWAASELTIPYVIGGGIGCGSQIAATIAMGGDGVIIGTRFLVANEIWAHNDYKQRLIESTATDTDLSMQSVRNTMRTLRNDTTMELKALESQNTDIGIEDLMHLVSGQIAKQAYITGDCRRGMLSAGQALAFVKRMEPLKFIVDELEQQMVSACQKIGTIN